MEARPIDQIAANSEPAGINNASRQLDKTPVVNTQALDSTTHDEPDRLFTSQALPLLPESDNRRSKADYGQECVLEVAPESTSTTFFSAGLMCPTKEDILKRPGSWLTVTLLTLATYATVFSGIFLIIALMRPRWGQKVGTRGHLSISTATFLSALFSKTVEIAFVTTSVTCLGQILSRRALLPYDNIGGITYGGESFNNFRMFQAAWANWTDASSPYEETASYRDRPKPITIMYDRTNTTLVGQWITPSGENITHDSMRYGRLVQNLTMAMPHANLLNAVQDRSNGIIQPSDLPGAEYLVEAAIPAPALNIPCVGLSTEELRPLIKPLLYNATTSIENVEKDPTAIDDVFDWKTDNVYRPNPRPIFPKIPIPYNTIAYVPFLYGPAAVYILATPPPYDSVHGTNDHIICSIRSTQYINCTTSYRAAQTEGQLTVHCDSDPLNTMPYYASVSPSIARIDQWEPDWKDIGSEWLRSVQLNSGFVDANMSSARILTQLIPQFPVVSSDYTFLPATYPSIAEAIAVLGMGTLVRVSFSAPFVQFWNYTVSVLEDPQNQYFKTRVTFSDYASTPTQAWQNLFYIVLLVVFVFSAASTAYLSLIFTRSGCVTDFTEPQNLFAVAINSPPSNAMAGTCGAGPRGEALGKKWVVEAEWTGATPDHECEVSRRDKKGRPHFYLRHQEESPLRKRFSRQLLKHEWNSIATTLRQ
ncbi:hypothetical protein H2200_008210 [Cladophialophora chaetospira]|uniref:Uncharacterized protein n=1 Tax=Cladophialophora chaetospira TaxID=386627 RepID=A0AA38X5C6_9EURO|nr:hypothetical protein H2200_008210 [Cladophialophora chaetospira]